jgi:CBS domain-containing protein
MKVKELGLKEIHLVNPNTPINEAAALMKRHGVGVLPVSENGELLGMLTDRDIVVGCVAAGIDAKDCEVQEFMTSEPVTISLDTDIETSAEILGKEQVRRLPVMDGNTLVGMLSLGDIATGFHDDSVIADTLRRISTPSQVNF